jgi:hypothetical protein
LSENQDEKTNNILLQTDNDGSSEESVNNIDFVAENNQDHLMTYKTSTVIPSECSPVAKDMLQQTTAEEDLIVEHLQNHLKANELSNENPSKNSPAGTCNSTSSDDEEGVVVIEKVLTKSPATTKIKRSAIREQILREQSSKFVPNIMNSIIKNQSVRNGFATIDESERSGSVVSVDAILEPVQQQGTFNGHQKIQDLYSSTDPIYSNEMNGNSDIELAPSSDTHIFHEACSSEDINIEELSTILRLNPQVASVRDEYGDYPAHIFANNDAVIYGQESDNEVLDFLFQLYCAYPEGSLTSVFLVDPSRAY